MSLTNTYYVASAARSKLGREAARPDHNLRRLVGHANLLDSLMLELAHAEREQEAWFNQSVRKAASPPSSKKPEEAKHIQWVDTIAEEIEEDSDSDSDSDDYDSDAEMFDLSVPLRRPRSPPMNISPSTELSDDDDDDDDEEEEEEDYPDSEYDAEHALTRVASQHSSSSSSSSSSSPPELLHDSSSDSDSDDDMPPSPEQPMMMIADFDGSGKGRRQQQHQIIAPTTLTTAFYNNAKDRAGLKDYIVQQAPMIEAC